MVIGVSEAAKTCAFGRFVIRLALLASGLLASSQAVATCADLLPTATASSGSARRVTASDLIRLRDIGSPDAATPDVPSPLAVSPDGVSVAFVISRADPQANAYCRALVVLRLDGGAPPMIVDRGGDYIPVEGVIRNMFVTIGTPQTVTPSWSRDSQWIVYRKRLGGTTQLWVARADGGGAHQLTHSTVDIEAAAYAADGRTVLYAARPGRQAAATAIESEGLSGWLYDGRATPDAGPRPQIRAADAPLATFRIDPATGMVTPPTALARDADLSTQSAAMEDAAPDGRRAWTEPETMSLLSPQRLWTTDRQGRRLRCDAAACLGRITGIYWDRLGEVLTYLRREGWNHGETAMYRWTPGSHDPVRTLLTEDVVQGCVATGDDLLCTRENSTTPRRLVMIDPASGRSRLLFDPNPEFHDIALGSVDRLRWRNDRGLEAWGDLVLPPARRAGEKLPLIVVQYHSDGFLRGGTNDDYPIFLFASRGFAVLSLERPPFVASLDPDLATAEEYEAKDMQDWAERRSLLSSLLTGVDAVIRRAPIDPARIGITGLSDGATTVRFALINTHRFAAAAMSSCCLEPNTVMTYGGPALAAESRRIGYPPATIPARRFWKPMSLSRAADHVGTPLLLQLANEEYLLALETFEALREHDRPVEMYVFPDEHHGKWQPAHRLAVYTRSLDWFAFWLQHRTDPNPAKREQYRRWDAMRNQRAAGLMSRVPRPRYRRAA